MWQFLAQVTQEVPEPAKPENVQIPIPPVFYKLAVFVAVLGLVMILFKHLVEFAFSKRKH